MLVMLARVSVVSELYEVAVRKVDRAARPMMEKTCDLRCQCIG